ncbi:ankyrin repeat and SOCS box protein 2b isoform X2 [Denticeps clupeoides]|uniref:ankyrin repeat and SOCS box protein 2b isoform X2 n=1 Tax=Denticeps clupeoides TaxID=299321 RepID=UPI0010A2BA83|nr:ankyrin repeat and SOCS box protein 2-like isoform X2 [Denticeps clupeoides]
MTRFSYAEYLSLFRRSALARRPGDRDGDAEDGEAVVSAIRRGDSQTVRELIASAPHSLTKENGEGWTPLHEAARSGQADCVEALLRAHGASPVDKRTLLEQTALLLAVEGEHASCAKSLLDAGADPDISNRSKATPLYKGRPRHCAVNKKTHIVQPTRTACENESAEMVRLLLSYGASVNQRCDRGWTALHEAVWRNKAELCEMLLKSGALLNLPNSRGITPTMLAAQQGRLRALTFLITSGADVNLHSCEGATALSEASRNGHKETVELLLSRGADANKPTSTGLLPLHIAAQHGHKEVVTLLLPVTSRARVQQSGITPLHLAAEHNRDEVVGHLIEAGVDVNARLSHGRSSLYHDCRATALYSSVTNGNADMAAALLRAGADPNLDPFSPLLVAVRQGSVRMAAMLVEGGASVNAGVPARPSGFPGVVMFCTQHLHLLRYLLEAGCDAQACFACGCGSRPRLADARSRQEATTPVPARPLQTSCTESSALRLQFCEWISAAPARDRAGPLISLLLDYVGGVPLCSRLTELLGSRQEWAAVKEKALSPRPLMHLCRQRIRQQVGVRRLGSLNTLPLPHRLHQYLCSSQTEP